MFEADRQNWPIGEITWSRPRDTAVVVYEATVAVSASPPPTPPSAHVNKFRLQTHPGGNGVMLQVTPSTLQEWTQLVTEYLGNLEDTTMLGMACTQKIHPTTQIAGDGILHPCEPLQLLRGERYAVRILDYSTRP